MTPSCAICMKCPLHCTGMQTALDDSERMQFMEALNDYLQQKDEELEKVQLLEEQLFKATIREEFIRADDSKFMCFIGLTWIRF
ncbi:hypothetical protein AOXY_G2406 [Acipenser oxyrinchus oxyrinchus]|uniref:Uncharacterized protein n=1 Tax=Acipenser oxyrinchus oxyrinchus TaxID=40147 RepID=A0AAD8LU61_ACIOX|nr:hypothetical protein AOXY_G2406 [Acipenser oxyrinchus oxyrinchus]